MVNGGRVRAVGCETIDLKRSKKRNWVYGFFKNKHSL